MGAVGVRLGYILTFHGFDGEPAQLLLDDEVVLLPFLEFGVQDLQVIEAFPVEFEIQISMIF